MLQAFLAVARCNKTDWYHQLLTSSPQNRSTDCEKVIDQDHPLVVNGKNQLLAQHNEAMYTFIRHMTRGGWKH